MPHDRAGGQRRRRGRELAFRNGQEHDVGRRDRLATPKRADDGRIPEPQGCRECGSQTAGTDNDNALLEQDIGAG